MFEEIRNILKVHNPDFWVEFDKLSEEATLPAIAIRETTGRVDESLCNSKRSSYISLLCKVEKRSSENRKLFQGLILFLNNHRGSEVAINQLSTLTSIDDDEKNNHYYEFSFLAVASNDLD